MDERRDFSNVEVLQISDLNDRPDNKRLTLDQKENDMVDNRCAVFLRNFHYLLQKSQKSQAQFCEIDLKGHPSPQQLAGYKRKGRDIPYRTMVRIATAFNKTVEEMTGSILEGPKEGQNAAQTNHAQYEKYCVTFDYAYFDTSAPLGNNRKPTPGALNYAVITICSGVNPVGAIVYHAYGLFHCTEMERTILYGHLNGLDLSCDAAKVQEAYWKAAEHKDSPEQDPRIKYLYEGTFQLEGDMVELSLHQARGSDFVHIMMHNRAATSSDGKTFSGGLATMMSVSRGEEHMPCLQAGLLSVPKKNPAKEPDPNKRHAFPYLSKEEVAQMLYLAPPEVNFDNEAKECLKYMKLISSLDTEDEDLQYTVEQYFKKKLIAVMRKNQLSYFKLSRSMDSEAYQQLKPV